MEKIILASKSPRRRELLERIGVSFEVEVSSADEGVSGDDPEDIVKELAIRKAEAVCANHPGECVTVIGADTIVVFEGEILGKPANSADAHRMLRELAGNEHRVYTGVCVLRERDGSVSRDVFAECTKVYVAPMDDTEIDAYIATGEPFDKAGSYGIQGVFARHIEKIDGDYFNVVGLPVGRLWRECLCGR